MLGVSTVNFKTSHFRKGSKGRQYCENLQKLISLLVNGSVPSGSTPEFLEESQFGRGGQN